MKTQNCLYQQKSMNVGTVSNATPGPRVCVATYAESAVSCRPLHVLSLHVRSCLSTSSRCSDTSETLMNLSSVPDEELQELIRCDISF
ncbi:hypothetical protein J6590_002321 [Homalodisca vitripennis]|nr:hypothetical protein J6590_002321 [Homalodisca vitripennis]